MVNYGPQPENVYKEWTYKHIGHSDSFHPVHIAEIDPNAKSEIACLLREEQPTHALRYITIDDLEDSIRAEIAVEYWGGHIGTKFKGFSINGSPWFPIGRPENTPREPERYYQTVLGSLPTQIPLEYLIEGVNCLQFGAENQIDYSFDCGFFWIYSFTIRVFYSPKKKHPIGKIFSPVSGETIDDYPIITADIENDHIAQIDFLGFYEDVNWEGDGIYRQWHAQRLYGTLRRHIGQRIAKPFSVIWNTEWIPDQEQTIAFAAQITDKYGLKFMTPATSDIKLVRKNRCVRMYKPISIPENFSVRVGEKKSCEFMVSDDLRQAKRARITLSTWSGAHAEEISLNGTKLRDNVGEVHDFSFDSIDIPIEFIRPGLNTFSIFSNTNEHAAEVNWPGPAILVEYSIT